MPDDARACLLDAQHDLFDLGGELSLPGHPILAEAHVARLEAVLDDFNAKLPPLKEFILPGGSRAAGLAHVARTVCRRAERRLVTLSHQEPVSPLAAAIPEPALGSPVRARARAQPPRWPRGCAVAAGEEQR